MKYTVKQYKKDWKGQWDQFITDAKNSTFLFYRDFMDYHSDRFKDYSLMVFKDNIPFALLPANIDNNVLYSHQGLSYGGLILDKKIKFSETYTIFKTILHFLEEQNIKSIQLKLLPKIYIQQTSDEIDYLLFKVKANLIRRDLASVIFMSEKKPTISSNRKQSIKKAQNNRLIVNEVFDFCSFWKEILEPNLQKNHQTTPVHTLPEISLLNSRFPKNIRQFNVYHDGDIIAGATIFETHNVVHVQYISASSEGRKLSALDFLFDFLIHKQFVNKKYFDFGTSNENQGQNINKGLLFWKESFRARSVVHDFYEINTANHSLLTNLFL